MKTVIITGGTSGIGLASAKIFLKNNYNCVLIGRSNFKGQSALTELNSNRAIYISADISKVDDCQRVVSETIEKFNRIDVLINSAGIYTEGSITDVNENNFDNIFATNVKGTFFMCKFTISELKKTCGSIVNIASDAAVKGNYYCALYAASKGAITALTKSLALELAHIPIRVNCVAPADVWTPLTQMQIKKSGETLESLESIYPMRRIAKAHEVAETIYFLSSDKASFITGTILLVDGGLTA